MSMDEIRWLGDMERLEIKPGDKFVLMVPGVISMEVHDRIQEVWEKFHGGDPDDFKLLILDQGIKLGVIGETA